LAIIKKKLILHCGTYKTGSSSLQNFLFANREILLSNSILYPLTGIRNDPIAGRRHFIYRFKKNTQLIEELLTEANESGAKYIIISHEALARPNNKDFIEMLVALFHANNFQVEGYLYVRNYYEYVIKYYREYVCRNATKDPFEIFIFKNKQILNYLKISNYLNNSIDKNVFIPYDSSKDTVACFFNETKLPFNYKNNDKKYEANKGKDFVITEIYRQLNTLGKKGQELNTLADLINNKYFKSAKQIKLYSDGIEDLSLLTPPKKDYLKKLSISLNWEHKKTEMLYINKYSSAKNLSKELKNDVATCLKKECLI
jgi:hypothetical protein